MTISYLCHDAKGGGGGGGPRLNVIMTLIFGRVPYVHRDPCWVTSSIIRDMIG